MSVIDKKVVPRKPGSKAAAGGGGNAGAAGGGQTSAQNMAKMSTGEAGISLNDAEDSDYSDSDFQDLMSNKQIEENIKVFFDRMHELVNPIDE